jgi:hypothetical protein
MGGAVNRNEPNNVDSIRKHPAVMQIFEQAGWLQFLEKFQGFDLDLTMEFAWSCDGSQATVRRLDILVSEESLSRVTGLSLQGEKWYKNFKVAPESWIPFLKAPSPLPDLRRGIARDTLSSPWDEVVFHL